MSCIHRHSNKLGEDEECLESPEVLREVKLLEESSLCSPRRMCLAPPPRGNPRCSPSIFSAGVGIDGCMKEAGIVTATVHANNGATADKNSDKGRGDAQKFESVDLGTSGKGEDEVASRKEHCRLMVKENTVGRSSLSVNTVFMDCREDSPPPPPSFLEFPASPTESFRSAINSAPPLPRTYSFTSAASDKVSPVCRIQFRSKEVPALLTVPSRKDPLWEQEEHLASPNQTLEL